MAKVLVVGASGNLGSRIVKELDRLGHEVFAMVHTLESRQKAIDMGVEQIPGDLTDIDTLKDVTKGIDTVIITTATLDESYQTGFEAVVVDALNNGVSHIVGISNAVRTAKHSMFRAKQSFENLLIVCGIPYTIWRLEILLHLLVDSNFVSAQTYNLPANFFANNELRLAKAEHCFIDENDAARLIAAGVGNPQTYNETIWVGGDKPLTLIRLLDLYNNVNKADLSYHVSLHPMPPYVPEVIFDLLTDITEYSSRTTGHAVFARFGLELTPIEESLKR